MQRIVTFVVTVLAFAVGPASALSPLADTSPRATLKGLLPTLPDISFRSKPTSAMVFKERKEGMDVFYLRSGAAVSIGAETTSEVEYAYSDGKLELVLMKLPAGSGAGVLSGLRSRLGVPDGSNAMGMAWWEPRGDRPYRVLVGGSEYTLVVISDKP